MYISFSTEKGEGPLVTMIACKMQRCCAVLQWTQRCDNQASAYYT